MNHKLKNNLPKTESYEFNGSQNNNEDYLNCVLQVCIVKLKQTKHYIAVAMKQFTCSRNVQGRKA